MTQYQNLNIVPNYTNDNLNQKFVIRPYQEKAFQLFDNHYNPDGRNQHVLFHMATGSGKTLVMAGIILKLYNQGFRDFLFFVNSTNIIEKTRENFLNSASAKYLFAENILINSERIQITEVSNFENDSDNSVNIVFTTIQGLHSRLNNPRENSITTADLSDRKIVMISDEAHHLNAQTKKGILADADAESWEETVGKILTANSKNILLEFTATMDFEHPDIKQKYSDKILFDYPLKQFCNDGYSKDVQVLQSSVSPMMRAIQAVILSQYRKRLFSKYGIEIKPVILFKSKTIKDSEHFYDEFRLQIKNINVEYLENIESSSNGILKIAFNYFIEQNIKLDNLVYELQIDFSAHKCISVNSRNDSVEKQLLLNSLEDSNNPYRAIFAVDKLNEGWDVLNLFDIVRLDKPLFVSKETIRRTTTSEAQLIGRGARYCPFKIDDLQIKDKRKYDSDRQNPLRICETLYYHAEYNPAYISALGKELSASGLTVENKIKRTLPAKTQQTKKISKNIFNQIYKINITLKSENSNGFENINTSINYNQPIYFNLLGAAVINRSLAKNKAFNFDTLKKIFPELNSAQEFVKSTDFLGKIQFRLPEKIELKQLSQEQKLRIANEIVQKLSKEF